MTGGVADMLPFHMFRTCRHFYQMFETFIKKWMNVKMLQLNKIKLNKAATVEEKKAVL